jgi:hypothetical protein
MGDEYLTLGIQWVKKWLTGQRFLYQVVMSESVWGAAKHPKPLQVYLQNDVTRKRLEINHAEM